jgi:hypothetical protein
MEDVSRPIISFVERLSNGVVVTFSDGRSVLFSATLLQATIPLADELRVEEREAWSVG